MKQIVFLILTLFTFGFAQNWQLVWQDEFNYNGVPDPTKWGYDTGNNGWGNNELENYTASRTENARAENGTLIIEARRDWYQGIEYSSARLVTRTKGDWKYGRIEVKAKIPLGAGMWPAIWMLPTDWVYGGWPASGEIDIMENFALNGIKPYSIEGNIHTQSYNHTIGTNKGASKGNLSQIEDNYHIYAVNWYDNHLEFEVDGVVYFTFANEGTWQTWPYDQRFHLILNVAVGGQLGTTPDPAIFPKKMIVDYVRVYQDSPEVPSTTGLVTLYASEDFCDHSVGLSVGDYTKASLEKRGLADNDLSSIEIAEGFRAVLFDGDNFSGNSTIIYEDDGYLSAKGWGDRVSSIRIETNGDETLSGSYLLQNRKTGYFLDARGGVSAVDNGVQIQQWKQNSNMNQQVKFTHLKNGCYKLTLNHSGKSLDVLGISQKDSTAIVQWEYLGSDNQQFILIETDSNYYKIIAKHSGKLVEVTGQNSAPEARVQQWENKDQLNGQWKLVEIPDIVELTHTVRSLSSLNILGGSVHGISVSVQYEGVYSVDLFGINGQKMYSIGAQYFSVGTHQVDLKTKALSSKVAIAIISGSGRSVMKKIFLY